MSLKVPVSRKVKFRVGTMLELPAAALQADRLAEGSEFFAFGTNDLTQTTLGISRDDSAHFLPVYMEKEIIKGDPFRELFSPVKELIDMAVSRGRRVRPDAKFGICGEQGGDPQTIIFCLEKGLNYVSCSPFRVLPAKVALVQTAMQVKALLRHQMEEDEETQRQAERSRPAKASAPKKAPLPGPVSGRLPQARLVARR